MLHCAKRRDEGGDVRSRGTRTYIHTGKKQSSSYRSLLYRVGGLVGGGRVGGGNNGIGEISALAGSDNLF